MLIPDLSKEDEDLIPWCHIVHVTNNHFSFYIPKQPP